MASGWGANGERLARVAAAQHPSQEAWERYDGGEQTNEATQHNTTQHNNKHNKQTHKHTHVASTRITLHEIPR